MQPYYKVRVLVTGEDMADMIVRNEYGPSWTPMLILKDIIERAQKRKFSFARPSRIRITEVQRDAL